MGFGMSVSIIGDGWRKGRMTLLIWGNRVTWWPHAVDLQELGLYCPDTVR